MNLRRRLFAAVALCSASTLGFANVLSSSPHLDIVPSNTPVEGGLCGTNLLTHSTSQVPVAGASVACSSGGNTSDNRYFRAYSMGAFPLGFDACEVQVGIETAASVTSPVAVRLYANTGGAFPAGNRVVIGSTNVNVADQSLTVLTVPLTASVPPGAELVVEVDIPDLTAVPGRLFVGSNPLGQTGPTYIASTACGLTAPTDVATINFPNMHLILNVRGTPIVGNPEVSVAPALLDFGLVDIGLTSGVLTTTVTNTGPVSGNYSWTAPSAPFTRTGGTCAGPVQTLAAGASCTLSYSFTPTNQQVTTQGIVVSEAGGASATFQLRGQGVSPPIAVPVNNIWALLAMLAAIIGLGLYARRRWVS